MSEVSILIAEDENLIAKDIILTLQNLGYKVLGAVDSASSIIEKASELKPDLILMDILLNGEMTGIDAAKIIQGKYDVPVVFLTALADDATLQKAKRSDAFGYILKPFDDKALRSAIEMALYKHKIAMQLKHRTMELEEEKLKSEKLLHNIFPAEIVTELKQKGAIAPREYKSVTLLFTDFQGFTKIAAKITPEELIYELNDIFKNFDIIINKYGLERLKTIGDSYMAAGGFPKKTDNHALKIISASIEMVNYLNNRNKISDYRWNMRLGIHSGNIIAGVVGKNKFTYDVWGDTVKIARQMERNSEPGKINISSSTYEIVKDSFNCELNSYLEINGGEKLPMYYVISPKESAL
jgi:class 3 adenylate cyclase